MVQYMHVENYKPVQEEACTMACSNSTSTPKELARTTRFPCWLVAPRTRRSSERPWLWLACTSSCSLRGSLMQLACCSCCCCFFAVLLFVTRSTRELSFLVVLLLHLPFTILVVLFSTSTIKRRSIGSANEA